MLIFIDSQGNVVGRTPGGLTQGSSKANVLQLVAPFPTAIASVSFQLPNGIVLGPGLEDGFGETANEYVMTEAFKIPGYGVGGSELTVFNFTCNKQITALAGNLGIQFFLSIGEIIEGANGEPPVYGGYTISVPMINVPVYNGTRFIPQPTMTADNTDFYSELLEKVSAILTNSQAAVVEADRAIRTADAATQTADNAADIANEVKRRAVLKDPPKDQYGQQTQRIEGTVATDHIIAYYIDAEGVIRAVRGVELLDGAPILIIGSDKNLNDVTYYIKGYKKLDENNNEYLAGIALIGVENSIEGKTNFLGDVEVRGTIYGQRANFTDADIDGNLNVSGNTRGDFAYFNEIGVDDVLNVYGRLNVNGPITSVSQEKLVVKDNIIVTNSDGLSFSSSGIVINKGNGKAYGILYQPAGDLVYIGEGTYSLDNEGKPNFSFDTGEALPLAARSDNFRTDNEIPVFDPRSKSLVPSGKTPSSFVPKSISTAYREAYVNNYGEDGTMRIVQDVQGNPNFGSYTIACRNPKGGMTVTDAINDFDAVNKRTLDKSIANSSSWTEPFNSLDASWLFENKPSEIIMDISIQYKDEPYSLLKYSCIRSHLIRGTQPVQGRNAYLSTSTVMVITDSEDDSLVNDEVGYLLFQKSFSGISASFTTVQSTQMFTEGDCNFEVKVIMYKE